MTNLKLPNGTQLASDVRSISGNDALQSCCLNTVGELLDKLRENPPAEFPVLKSTCVRLADYLSTQLDQMSLDMVKEKKDGFRDYLAGRKHKEGAIKSYVNHARILLRHAESLGWKPGETIPTAWKLIASRSEEYGCARAVKHMMRRRATPQDVSSEDVGFWADEAVRLGAGYQGTVSERGQFWRLLRDFGCTQQIPGYIFREKKIGIRHETFPVPLRTQVVSLLIWKQAEFAVDRPRGGRVRKVTANRLEEFLEALFGFCVHVLGRTDISSLEQLVQKGIVSSYLEWGINERKMGGYGLQCGLRLLFAAMRSYPELKGTDFSWWKSLHDSIPVELESERRRRKAAKYLDYSALESIPSMIRESRLASRSASNSDVSELVMHELLMRWLTILPWRQRNLRECRIGGPNRNLFKAPVPLLSEINKPKWAAEEEKRNPAAEFWQFSFSPAETKTKRRVQALLPRPLVPILEEYLSNHRDRLLKGSDSTALFIGKAGHALLQDQVGQLVSTLTLRYGGKRVTPHLFRDIVAFTWLEDHPDDYLRLSKLLWHTNINTTIKTYGGRFNESSGVCAMESWLEERAKRCSSK